MRRFKGFTLIELVVVISIIAILTTIALPSYNDFVLRAKLRTGTEALSAYRSLIEQAYQDSRSYRTADDSACLIASFVSENFSVTCTATSDLLYVLTATNLANKGLGSAGRYTYTINQDGTMATTQFKGSADSSALWKYK